MGEQVVPIIRALLTMDGEGGHKTFERERGSLIFASSRPPRVNLQVSSLYRVYDSHGSILGSPPEGKVKEPKCPTPTGASVEGTDS